MKRGMIANSLAALCVLGAASACKDDNSDDVLARDTSLMQGLSLDSATNRRDLPFRSLTDHPLLQPSTSDPRPRTRSDVTSPRSSCSTYQSLVANVWPGKELFLASDCNPIGRVVEIQNDYAFPDGTRRDAILISFKDGSADWVPRKTAQLLYLTR